MGTESHQWNASQEPHLWAVGQQAVSSLRATHYSHQGSNPRGCDIVGQCWAWGIGIVCAARVRLADMKSQNPATNEKWKAQDVMSEGSNYQLWGSVEAFKEGINRI